MKKLLPSESSSSLPWRGKKRPLLEPTPLPSHSNEPIFSREQEQQATKQKNIMRRPRPQKIIVLGAGVSGLACSRELRQRGYEVLLLEARSRVGGRLKGEILELGSEYPCTLPASASLQSKTINENKKKRSTKKKNKDSDENSDTKSNIHTTRQHPIDVGGALIHGIENNPIHHITSQMGIPTHAITSYCLLMDENGWPFDPKVDEKSNNFFNECLDITFARAEKDRESKESFGELFEKVCREKLGMKNSVNGRSDVKNGEKSVSNWETPLLKWHRTNLELPSGASFFDLGYTWNDDEPYGFEGAHAAVESSWKLVMEQLAEGLDIRYNSPVAEIRMVLPNGTTPLEIPQFTKPMEKVSSINITGDHINKTKESIEDEKDETNQSELTIVAKVKEESVKVKDEIESQLPSPTIAPVKKILKRFRKPKKAFNVSVDRAESRRFSRRTRNIDADVRRSIRSTKGVIERLDIDRSYHKSTRRKRRKTNNLKGRVEGKRSKNLVDDGEPVAETEKNKTNGNNHDEKVDYAPSSVVQVTLQDGSVLEADALVCTLPLGVLKLSQKDPSHVRFVPSLPPTKKDAIESLGCGLLNKCAISFPKVFWQDSDFLGQAESDYSYLVLNAMKYSQKPILIFMYGGDFAKDIEDWTDREIVSDCLEVLRKICGIREIPAPVDYCVTRWGKEKYSRMSFTYVPPGIDGVKALAAMSQPIYDPVLPEKPLMMFAGEHTTPYHPSTMHGAFLSGIREAYRFDLYMEPLLNDQMAFDENIHVYKHTFPTKRVYKKTRNKRNTPKLVKASNSGKNGSFSSSDMPSSNGKTHSRRRGFSGMTLRKRPDENIDQQTDDTTTVPTPVLNGATSTRKNGVKNGNVTNSSPRRSQRSTGSGRNSILARITNNSRIKSNKDKTHEDSETVEKVKSMNKDLADQQEERSLLRAFASYGPDSHSLVLSHILPVYGSTRRRNFKYIDDQWKRQYENSMDTATNEKQLSIVELTKSWTAKNVVSDSWDTHFARIAADAAKEATVPDKIDASKTPRRSVRGSKTRNFFDP